MQLSEDAENRRIFWLIETVGTENNGDYGLNFFSLYSLSFAPNGQDSAVDLNFSRLRQRTALIANITARDCDLTYEGLQKAVDNLAKMYNDTLDLSSRAGNHDPCHLPISADIADFEKYDTGNSLSSFQSDLADSLQLSLIVSPVNLHITPLSQDTIPIIPNPLPAPKSSTPNLQSQLPSRRPRSDSNPSILRPYSSRSTTTPYSSPSSQLLLTAASTDSDTSPCSFSVCKLSDDVCSIRSRTLKAHMTEPAHQAGL